ncbi:helix-turn-helix domain-containing protein [Paenarthrobacter sp. YIM B13468]|uniref:helix-turn-helix domain-containing protein n=1 Tax=Paenarthrobacter sp. YIM B13468 TaxID=3366295 RepID=UPI00366C6110
MFALVVIVKLHRSKYSVPVKSTEKQLGSVVRKLRQAAGLTQEQLAQQLTAEGLPTKQNTVAKLENGLRPTSVTEFSALARLFNLSVAELSDAVFPRELDAEQIKAAEAERSEHWARIGELHILSEYLQDTMGAIRGELAERGMRAALLDTRLGDHESKSPIGGGPVRGAELDAQVAMLLRRYMRGEDGNAKHSEA